ncbi:MAG: DUF922 domain-containing protein [Proteobacteria bacterium]|nr:MAG: DUF922 domain-containing protein [Pseudomonadota bacterium]
MIAQASAPCALAAMLCLLVSVPALARVPVSVSQLGYPVDLADATDLQAALTAASPVRVHGNHSQTRWFIRWRTFWRADNGLCRMQRVSTEVDIEFTLPDAIRLPRRTELRQRYAEYLAALRTHEQGHADLAVQAAREIEQALMAVPPHPDCDGLSAAANRRGNAIIDQTRARELAYDEATGRGRTQGASLD